WIAHRNEAVAPTRSARCHQRVDFGASPTTTDPIAMGSSSTLSASAELAILSMRLMLLYNNRTAQAAVRPAAAPDQGLRQRLQTPCTSSVCAWARKPSALACASIDSATRSSQTSSAPEQTSQIRNGTWCASAG